METLPEELLLKICSHLQICDRSELSFASKRFNRVIHESWQDYAVSIGWTKINENHSWLETCKHYFNYRRKWFLGKYSESKIYFESSNCGRSQNVLSSLTRYDNSIGVGTNQSISCFCMTLNEDSGRHYEVLKILYKEMDAAANSLCLSNTYISVIDDLTSELVVINLENHKELRAQLKFNLVYDFCHITKTYIILLTDNGEIYMNVIGQNEVVCIHHENEEVSYSYVSDDWHLIVSFWSGKLISYNLNKPKKPIISLQLDHVMYSMQVSVNYLYFGTADGIIGRIKLNDSMSDQSVSEFERHHSGSVYSIATNKYILVSGGADSMVIFWNLQGTVRYIDYMSHVGIVRHIFLNDWIMMTAGDAHVIIVWDPINLALKHIFHHNPLKIKFMAANETSMVYGSPDSNYVIFLSVA